MHIAAGLRWYAPAASCQQMTMLRLGRNGLFSSLSFHCSSGQTVRCPHLADLVILFNVRDEEIRTVDLLVFSHVRKAGSVVRSGLEAVLLLQQQPSL